MLIVTAFCGRIAFGAAPTEDAARQIVSLYSDWHFHLGDIPEATSPAYDDHGWRRVDVPHDYVIEGTFDPKVQAGLTQHWYVNHASLPVQPAWYRKVLSIPESSGASDYGLNSTAFSATATIG